MAPVYTIITQGFALPVSLRDLNISNWTRIHNCHWQFATWLVHVECNTLPNDRCRDYLSNLSCNTYERLLSAPVLHRSGYCPTHVHRKLEEAVLANWLWLPRCVRLICESPFAHRANEARRVEHLSECFDRSIVHFRFALFTENNSTLGDVLFAVQFAVILFQIFIIELTTTDAAL